MERRLHQRLGMSNPTLRLDNVTPFGSAAPSSRVPHARADGDAIVDRGGGSDDRIPTARAASWRALLPMLVDLGAAAVKHSNGTLLEHLVATAEILERWGVADDVVRAGLFHSIYGTEIFAHATASLEAQPRIREALGESAERLVFLFCTLERSSILRAALEPAPRVGCDRRGARVQLSRADVSDLLHLLWANELEQRSRVAITPRARARERQAFLATRKWLRRIARQELEEGLVPAAARARAAAAAAAAAASEGSEARPRLARLLNSKRSSDFLREGWFERLHIAHGPLDRLAGLCDYDFDSLSSMHATYRRAFYNRDGVVHTVDLKRGEERQAYDAGATVYFHGVMSPMLEEWISDLNQEIGLVAGLTRVSAFASKTGRGLPTHYDLNDNFVCQARGKKRWRLAPNTHVRFPLYGYTIGKPVTPAHLAEAPLGLPREMPANEQTIEMLPGTVMFVPRGMWHATETTDDASLHFNIQCGMPTYRDLIDFVLSRLPLRCGADLRAPVLDLFDTEGSLSPRGFGEVAKKLEAVLASLQDSSLAAFADEFGRYATLRRTRLFEYAY